MSDATHSIRTNYPIELVNIQFNQYDSLKGEVQYECKTPKSVIENIKDADKDGRRIWKRKRRRSRSISKKNHSSVVQAVFLTRKRKERSSIDKIGVWASRTHSEANIIQFGLLRTNRGVKVDLGDGERERERNRERSFCHRGRKKKEIDLEKR